MKVKIETQLVMWEKQELPERRKNEATGEWEKTGHNVEKTLYYLRDEWGDMLKFLADNEYRNFEGSMVEAELDITYNDYQNKTVVKLVDITQIG